MMGSVPLPAVDASDLPPAGVLAAKKEIEKAPPYDRDHTEEPLFYQRSSVAGGAFFEWGCGEFT